MTAVIAGGRALHPEVHFVFGSKSLSLGSGTTVSTKIWVSSLVAADRIHRELGDFIGGKRVLEVGCGVGLVGLVAALHGPRSVTFTDCADKALVTLRGRVEELQKEGSPSLGPDGPSIRIFHHLWEQDEDEASREPRHWSNVERLPEHPDCQTLPDSEDEFDLIIASDCLYFPSQELPLAAVLRRRLAKEGLALIVVQTRANGGLQLVRFRQTLEESGFCAESEDTFGNEYHAKLMNEYVRFGEQGEVGEAEDLETTGKETGEHVLMVRWKRAGEE